MDEVLETPNQGAGGQHTRTALPIVALVGEDVLLPCRLESASDPVSMIVEWGRPDLKPRFVHVWHEGKDLLSNQNPSYRNRTLLSVDKLKLGDLSLTLFKVILSDSGTYRCFTPQLNRESTVKLIVGAVSLPSISGISINNNNEVLQCESKGWYPEPEVFWLDGEGNLLTARPTESLKGPDGLFTVSSKLTVEKTKRGSFTCRVHQQSINQTTETIIQITASDKGINSSHLYYTLLWPSVTIILVLELLLIGLLYWKKHLVMLTLKMNDPNKHLQTMVKEDAGYAADDSSLCFESNQSTKPQTDKDV
ncbi:butyrophilin-like protein 10 [Halichoeres trimaculatus]|uniref:butyrophilin-like protein 10 n=1 Tax=Halichoeres trimaculatus TaxID=147232 RepID=UPI003D9F9EC8